VFIQIIENPPAVSIVHLPNGRIDLFWWGILALSDPTASITESAIK